MGVKVDRSDRGWEVAVTSVNLTDKGRQLFRKDVLVWLISIPTPVENPFLPPLVLHWIYIPDDPIPGRTSTRCIETLSSLTLPSLNTSATLPAARSGVCTSEIA